ncbi:MAG: hypothetical protein N3A61_00255, partial [Ignavibacteria bacterium]|nr:hypothetical protein [Ignavibacteria bacterium]
MFNFKIQHSILNIKYFSLLIFPIILFNSSMMIHSDSTTDEIKFKANDVSIFSVKTDPWVEQTLSKLTLEEKAGQMVFPSAPGRYMSDDSQEYQNLVQLVRDKKVGGLIFFLSDIYGQAVLTNKLQQIAE